MASSKVNSTIPYVNENAEFLVDKNATFVRLKQASHVIVEVEERRYITHGVGNLRSKVESANTVSHLQYCYFLIKHKRDYFKYNFHRKQSK